MLGVNSFIHSKTEGQVGDAKAKTGFKNHTPKVNCKMSCIRAKRLVRSMPSVYIFLALVHKGGIVLWSIARRRVSSREEASDDGRRHDDSTRYFTNLDQRYSCNGFDQLNILCKQSTIICAASAHNYLSNRCD